MSTLFPCGNEYRPGYRPLPNPIKKPPPGGGGFTVTKTNKFGIPPTIPPNVPTVPPPVEDRPPPTTFLTPVNPGQAPGGGGGGVGDVVPGAGNTFYRCQQVSSYCPDNETVRRVDNVCVPFQTTGVPPQPYFTSFDACRSSAICGPSTGDLGPCPGVTADLLNQVINPQIINTGLVSLRDQDRTTRRLVSTADLRDSVRDSIDTPIFQGTQLQGNRVTLTYDLTKNIINYSNVTEQSFVNNTKYLNILNTSIAKELYYLLYNDDPTKPWKEKNILGVTYDKIYNSLNTKFKENINSILDVNGKKIDIESIVYGIFNHILNGTLDTVNTEYYENLALYNSSRTELTYSIGEAKDDTEFVYDYINVKKLSASPKKYIEPQHKIEVSRLKFLPSDIEVKIKIQTLDEGEQLVTLDDPGLSFTDNNTSQDHVPLGEGDGYYIVVEKQSSLVVDPLDQVLEADEEALILDTSLDYSYYVPLQDRKTALDLLGKSSEFLFTVSSSMINSELSSGYQEVYESKAKYYKLDLSSIVDERSDNHFVNKITARYVKVLNQSDREIHSRTYGGKTQKLNLSYDDPFIQYADREGEFTLEYNELTFRNFDKNLSPDGSSILLRSLPDAIIILPTNTTEQNPYNGHSIIKTITEDTVVREVTADTDIGLTVDRDINRQSLPYKYTYDYLGDFKFGLAGIEDSQNILYIYDPDDFTDTYIVSGRPPVGKAIYDILENTISKKYSFDYLTWWDLYRRMPMLDFMKFLNEVPHEFLDQLTKSWRGYKFKDVLYRGPNYTLDNLTEIDPTVEDRIILEESFDRFN